MTMTIIVINSYMNETRNILWRATKSCPPPLCRNTSLFDFPMLILSWWVIHGLGRGEKVLFRKCHLWVCWSWVELFALSHWGRKCFFVLIMVWLVAKINMPMVSVLLFPHDLSDGHSYEPYMVVTFFLAFWWWDVNIHKEGLFIWHKWGIGVWR